MQIKYILFKFPAAKTVYCAFQGRSENSADSLAGNISYKTENDSAKVLRTRETLLATLKPYGLEAWSECNQAHGKDIVINPESTPPAAQPDALPCADGMMTNRPGLGLLIKTADCQPVFITDADGEHVMALHVGWRGNRLDFPGYAINEFCKIYNLQPKKLLAVRGPSLGPASSEFINFDREWGQEWRRWFNTKTGCMNLWSLTRWQLMTGPHAPALLDENIFGIDICTAQNCNAFFSYRKNKNTGRQANLVWIAD